MAKYGWIPDVPDHRDRTFSLPNFLRKGSLPQSVDLRGYMPPVYDQGDLGSCTGNAIGAAIAHAKARGLDNPKGKFFQPSRLFIYYNERVMEGTVSSDAGAQIRNGIKSVAKQGVCTEALWPYEESAFRKKPSKKAYAEGLLNQAISYSRVPQTLEATKGCLAGGHPFVFGFSVFEGFEGATVAKKGILELPKKAEKNLGGHAVLCVGFEERTKRFLVRNSWGPKWGLKGYFWMPYQYVLDRDLSDDLWTIRLVE